MSAAQQVKRISYDKWPELRDLFRQDWPKNCLPYHLIQNYLDWRTKDPDFVENNIELNCLNGDWSDGTFYALVRIISRAFELLMMCEISF